MSLKHPLRRTRLQRYLSFHNRILLRNIHPKMHMITSKTKLCKLKTKPLKFFERINTSVDVRLLQKTIIPTLRHKHQSNPIIPSINTHFHKKHTSNFRKDFIAKVNKEKIAGSRIISLRQAISDLQRYPNSVQKVV